MDKETYGLGYDPLRGQPYERDGYEEFYGMSGSKYFRACEHERCDTDGVVYECVLCGAVIAPTTFGGDK